MKKFIVAMWCMVIMSMVGVQGHAVQIESYDTDGRAVQWELEPNGGMPVNLQDQTSPPLIIPLSRSLYQPSLTADTAIDDTTIVVDVADGFIDGAQIVLADPTTGRYYIAHQVGAIATLTVTVDTPLDAIYSSATTEVSVGTHDIQSAAGTLASPVIYSVRAGEQTDIPVEVDITRLIFTCTSATASDFTNFCGITSLTNGLVLRRTDGTQSNIFNVKSNLDLANIMYDFQIFLSSIGQQGIDGFMGRLTFGGQNKMGVVIRLGPGEDLELLVQDDITGLTTFSVIAEGHVTVGEGGGL